MITVKDKKTLVIGASLKEMRYSNMAIHKLRKHHVETLAIGLRGGTVAGVVIQTGFPEFQKVHTVTLYLNPSRQAAYYDYIVSLNPQRVIFNPGTENPEFYKLLQEHNIEVDVACTLVLLNIGQY